MQTWISNILGTITHHILGLTLYDMMRSSPDFEDVRAALKERIDWSIELFRSCFAIHLSNGNYSFMLCTLSFLALAENMRIHYGRLTAAELKERAGHIGHATFAILFAVPDVGSVVVRITALVALSGSPALAANLALISTSPSIVLPLLAYPARLFKQRKREPTVEVERGSEAVID